MCQTMKMYPMFSRHRAKKGPDVSCCNYSLVTSSATWARKKTKKKKRKKEVRGEMKVNEVNAFYLLNKNVEGEPPVKFPSYN